MYKRLAAQPVAGSSNQIRLQYTHFIICLRLLFRIRTTVRTYQLEWGFRTCCGTRCRVGSVHDTGADGPVHVPRQPVPRSQLRQQFRRGWVAKAAILDLHPSQDMCKSEVVTACGTNRLRRLLDT